MKRYGLILLLLVFSFSLSAGGESLDLTTLQIAINLEPVLEMKVCDQTIHGPGIEAWENLEPIQFLDIKPGENKQIWALVMTNANCGFILHGDAPNLTAEGISTQVQYEVGGNLGAVTSYEPPFPPENHPTVMAEYPAPGEGLFPADHPYGIPHGPRIMGRGIVFTLDNRSFQDAVEGFYTAQITFTLVVD